MSRICAIEIHDTGLTVVDSEGIRLVSPACAVLENGRLLVGAEAAARARLDPRRTFDRFWQRLDQEPLPAAAPEARTRADLAYVHLRAVWEEAGAADEVLLTLPPGLDAAQRSLVVGIAHASDIPIAGVCEATVASAATIDDPRPRLVLDAGLHQTTATIVSAASELALGEHRTIVQQGLGELYDTWISMIAGRFVRETRFDPLHEAGTEQLSYDRLPAWLTALRLAPTATAELPVGERRYRVELTRESLADAARSFYRSVAAAASVPGYATLVAYRLAALPGFPDAVAGSTALEPGAAGRAALAHLEEIRSDGRSPAFVTRLPGPIPEASRVAGSGASEPAAPSHVLHRWNAYPIGQAPLLLDADPPRALARGESAHGCVLRLRAGRAVLEAPETGYVLLNGRPVHGETSVAPGDAIRIGADGEELRLIILGRS